ncbi:hypothetical protein [Rheinheimera sp.]|uniref:hypothetical protein n=1 Tax=Rheinheimera sp. TaxID=1869214 RepID=UPI0027348543|nr:hypothetical protein [Rheinheimera sp.]MDP2714520.1 hypothetical protein [Rheinheimera sp.]
MQQAGQPYQLLSMPWRRAKQEVKMGRIDGYFTAFPNEGMQGYAQLSAPLFLENWYWFWHQRHAGLRSQTKIRYGAILGSHQADWFNANDYKPELEVGDIAQLVQLLAIGRIDIILADLDDFNHAVQRLKLPPQQYRQAFLRYIPLGVYFSSARLQQQPDFMPRFNAAVHLCASAPFALAEQEQQLIAAQLLHSTRELARDRKLIAAVQQQNQQQLSLSEIMQRDAAWQQKVQLRTAGAVAAAQLSSPTAELLRSWQANTPGLITEVILMDNQGANVAISDMTTDYWQGDETPFLSVFEQQHDYFIDVVEYDQSTQRFQVKLSVPLLNADGRHIGALSIGIDVERALTQD